MSNHTPEGQAGLAMTALVVLERGSGGFGPNWRTTPAPQSRIAKLAEDARSTASRPGSKCRSGRHAAARRRLTTSTSTWSTTRSICQRVLTHLAMADRAMVLKQAPSRTSHSWHAFRPKPTNRVVVKQALDMGLHGVFFNGVDTPEQALTRCQLHAVSAPARFEQFAAKGHSRLRSRQRNLAVGPDDGRA